MSSQRGSSAQDKRQPQQPKQPQPARAAQAASRREEYERRRRERQHQAGRQAQIQRLKRRGAWTAGIAAAALVVFLIAHAVTSGGGTRVGTIPGVVTYSNLARDHVSGTVKYPQTPPVGGPHAPVWLNCGIYDTPVANENAVHALEHGAVWITYQPTLAAGDVQHLTSLVKGHAYVILSPYTGLPAPVVASAWGVQLPMQSAYDSRISQFIQKYAQGPQTPEPGAPCSGGVGAPVG